MTGVQTCALPISLNFDIHKLLATGYSLTENADHEIDEFLDMIETHYLK